MSLRSELTSDRARRCCVTREGSPTQNLRTPDRDHPEISTNRQVERRAAQSWCPLAGMSCLERSDHLSPRDPFLLKPNM